MSDTLEQRIILANGSRLLREMLNRILLKTEHLDVVQEVTDHENLPYAIEQQEAEWVIISLPDNNPAPEWIDAYMRQHPYVRFLTVSADGSLIKMKWLESHEEDLSDLSLKELINILESDSIHS